MKLVRWFIPFAVLVFGVILGVMGASAAGAGPIGAPYVDSGVHTIVGDATTWYRFEYAGNHSQITIRLVGAKDKGMAFQVYPPTMLDEWWKNDGVGAGSVQNSDLLWTGNAHERGTWYIKVINYNLAPTSYQLLVTGSNVTLSSILPAFTELSPTTPSLDNADPNNAFLADTTLRAIPAKTTLWYRFYYAGDHSQVFITMPNGADNKLRFHVHAPSQMSSWWNATPIGQSNIKDKDLVWNGNSHEAGWWYIEVKNENPTAIGFTLNIAGEKVWFTAPSDTTIVTPPAVPAIASTLENADPNKALTADANLRVIPAKTTLWYRFAYRGLHDQTTLTIPDGNKNLLRVHVHTPEQMKTWWNVNPIGQAMPKGDNLVWSGNAQDGGWWYVEVINDNSLAQTFQLLLQTQERY